MKKCLKEIINFYKKDSYNNFIIAIIIFLNTLNLYIFINSKYCVPITIILLGIYYYISNLEKKKKDKIIMTWLTFSMFTLLGESIIISNKNGISLNYNNSDIYNVSSWLFSAYASMVLCVILIYDYYEKILD